METTAARLWPTVISSPAFDVFVSFSDVYFLLGWKLRALWNRVADLERLNDHVGLASLTDLYEEYTWLARGRIMKCLELLLDETKD